jgi:hypothetical protein
MLPGDFALYSKLKSLPPAQDAITGGTNFANAIGDYLGQVQAGPTGSPGILTFNASIFGSLTAAMPPDPTGKAWPSLMASNFQTAMLASIINPGTVVNPSWIISQVDILTAPSAAATIITLPLAVVELTTQLSNVKADATAPLPIAKAFDAAIQQFQFLCIGLTFAGSPTPLPLTFGAR